MQSYGDARFRSYGFDNDMEMETESESPNAVAAGVKSKSSKFLNDFFLFIYLLNFFPPVLKRSMSDALFCFLK